MSFFNELKRRNVLRVAAGYIVTAWLIIQVADTVLPQFGLEYRVRTVITVLAIGFVPAMILAWALEWTPEGIKLDPGADAPSDQEAAARAGRQFDRIVIVILTLALGWFVYDKVMPAAPDVHYSVAVLPFSNESPDAVPGYLPEGLAGEVRDLIAKLPELYVIERSSSFSFRGDDVSLLDIGKRLGVSHLLTGAVSHIGSGLRIRARLLDAGTGEPLWTRDYSGKLDDVFAIQDAIAGDVVTGLELRNQSSLPASRRTTPEVFALTLQAKQIWNAEFGNRKGEEMTALLDEALIIDPNYVPAMVWKIYANWTLRQEGLITAEEENERWLALAARILAIEPENARVHNLFAWSALFIDHDIQAAAASYARALKSAPNDTEILRLVARFALLIGREEDALAIIERSIAIDPLCSLCLYGASKLYMYAGRLERAIAFRQRFVALHEQGHYDFGVMALLHGEATQALAIFDELAARMAANEQNDGRAYAGLAMTYWTLGRAADSDEQLSILRENFGESNPSDVARAYAWRNDKDAAFEWLARAEDSGHPEFTQELLLNPVYSNLRGDPRWETIRAARGFSEKELATLDFPKDLLARYREE